MSDLKPHGPGLIGMPCGEANRTSDITPALMGLNRPPGTKFKKQPGLGPAHPLNIIGEAFMSDPNLEWLFLTNDDNLCPPDALMRLLDRHLPVVSGLYFGRHQPFLPVCFDQILPAESVEADLKIRTLSNKWYRRHLMSKADEDMEQMVAVPDGCLLVRREVMESIPQPWWEYGETVSSYCDHDMVFSRKMRDAGWPIWLDTTVRVDHVTQLAVRPHREADGTWSVHLVQGEDGRYITLSAPRPEGE